MSSQDEAENAGWALLLVILLVIGGISKCSDAVDDWFNKREKEHQREVAEERVREAKSDVMSFLKDMNPELYRQVSNIYNEMALADNKIQQLRDLKEKHPTQGLIDETLAQWQRLRNQLSQVSENLYRQIEGAYVAYEIDKIQGRNNLSLISQALLKEANAALTAAEATKSVIEEQL